MSMCDMYNLLKFVIYSEIYCTLYLEKSTIKKNSKLIKKKLPLKKTLYLGNYMSIMSIYDYLKICRLDRKA